MFGVLWGLSQTKTLNDNQMLDWRQLCVFWFLSFVFALNKETMSVSSAR